MEVQKRALIIDATSVFISFFIFIFYYFFPFVVTRKASCSSSFSSHYIIRLDCFQSLICVLIRYNWCSFYEFVLLFPPKSLSNEHLSTVNFSSFNKTPLNIISKLSFFRLISFRIGIILKTSII